MKVYKFQALRSKSDFSIPGKRKLLETKMKNLNSYAINFKPLNFWCGGVRF